jgi:hypothetical protein
MRALKRRRRWSSLTVTDVDIIGPALAPDLPSPT